VCEWNARLPHPRRHGRPADHFAARSVPAGLTLDTRTGVITGQLKRAGEYHVTASAVNAKGRAKANLRIVVGDTLALTPPLGGQL